MNPNIKFSVNHHEHQGDRPYMEDRLAINYERGEDDLILSAYFAVFDGHGGYEAAEYTKNHILEFITSQKDFYSLNDTLIMKAIKKSFERLHSAMYNERNKSWPKLRSGHPSAAGTTATIVFVKNGKLYVAHVGDSTLVLGFQEPNEDQDPPSKSKNQSVVKWKAERLTQDHNLKHPSELKRIEASGGSITIRKGIPRVVWKRPRYPIDYEGGTLTRSTPVDSIPILNLARSLGDFWSFNPVTWKYVVSPVPDIQVVVLDPDVHRCIILASDGLWNAVSPRKAVEVVYSTVVTKKDGKSPAQKESQGSTSTFINSKENDNPAVNLIDLALQRYRRKKVPADNISVISVVFEYD
ncbi:unnamed protein product [Orchesella dallaii]|uniref:PPM-type phosphatase domain-containing protein n=1 Tax=Orchesella dallaii TaxID=48710 RepID=A0ABP1S9X6_9HEXA